MKSLQISFSIVLGTALVGCVSRPMPPPTVTVVMPAAAPQADAELKSPGQLKAYQIGAYVDPNNSSVLHQAHSIYVEEHSPTWNLNSPVAAAGVLRGPNPVPVDSAVNSQRTRDELLGELEAQRKASKSLQEHSQMLLELVRALGPQLQSMEQLRKSQRDLQGTVEQLGSQFRPVDSLLTNRPPRPQLGTNSW